MEATAAAILVQAMLQSSPPLQGSLREDLQKGGPTGRCGFLESHILSGGADVDEGGRKRLTVEKNQVLTMTLICVCDGPFSQRVLPMAYAFDET